MTDNNFDSWDSLKKLLQLPLENNKKLDIVLARGVGLWLLSNNKALTNIMKDLLEGDSRHIQLNRDAIDEAICKYAGDLVVDILLNMTNSYSDIPKQRRHFIISLFQDRIFQQKKTKGNASEENSNQLRISSLLSLESRKRLADWLAPMEDEDPSRFFGILIVLSDDLPDVQVKVKQLINQLGQAVNTIISKMHFVPEYVEQYIQMTGNDKESRKAFAKIQSIKARTTASEEDISKLMEQAKDCSKEVAVAAAKALVNFVGKQKRPDIDDWISVLESSNFSGVRRYCLDALNKLVKRDMTDKHLARIWANLSNPRKSKLQETQNMGDLVASWIDVYQCVPSTVADLLNGIMEYLQTTWNGRVAGALFNVFKVITRTKERATLLPKLIEWTRTILINVNVKTINNGQSEVAQVLRLINDIEPGFLRLLVEQDCPKMQPQNVCAVVEAIHKCGGAQLSLLEDIRRSSWCPPEASALISKLQLKG